LPAHILKSGPSTISINIVAIGADPQNLTGLRVLVIPHFFRPEIILAGI